MPHPSIQPSCTAWGHCLTSEPPGDGIQHRNTCYMPILGGTQGFLGRWKGFWAPDGVLDVPANTGQLYQMVFKVPFQLKWFYETSQTEQTDLMQWITMSQKKKKKKPLDLHWHEWNTFLMLWMMPTLAQPLGGSIFKLRHCSSFLLCEEHIPHRNSRGSKLSFMAFVSYL